MISNSHKDDQIKPNKTLTYESVERWIAFALLCKTYIDHFTDAQLATREVQLYVLRGMAFIASTIGFSLAEGQRYQGGFGRMLRQLNHDLYTAWLTYTKEEVLNTPKD